MTSYEPALAILGMALGQGRALADRRSDNCQDIEAVGNSLPNKNAKSLGKAPGAGKRASAVFGNRHLFVLAKYSETKGRTDLCYTVH